MFEDDNRTSRRGIIMLPGYNKTIVARCDWGPWVLYTLGGKRYPWLRLGAISPLGWTKCHGPHHSVQQLFCYTLITLIFLFSKFCCNLKHLRRSIHCLISRRTRNNSWQFPRTRACFIQRWKSTNGENNQGDVHRCTSLFILPGTLCITRSAHL